MAETAGVDGCKAGWIVAHDCRAFVVPTFADVIATLPPACVIALDMPIGLLDSHEPGGRACDRALRAVLGSTRRGSVFSAPPRAALGSRTLPEAQARGARINLQTLNILPKIEDVDAVMTPALQRRVHEAHPECAFMAMNDGIPVAAPKRSADGRAQRIALLTTHGVPIPEKPRGAAMDDLLDACALTWSAERIAGGTAVQVLSDPPLDAHGLAMQVRW